jgi:hypothetical protein
MSFTSLPGATAGCDKGALMSLAKPLRGPFSLIKVLGNSQRSLLTAGQ